MPKIDPTEKYIRDICRALDTSYDREAVRLICGVGIFATENTSEIADAVGRLSGERKGLSEEIIAAQNAAASGNTAQEREAAVLDLESLNNEQQAECIDAAYYLGIAVGRRLGSALLAPADVRRIGGGR